MADENQVNIANVELEGESKQLLKNTESTTQSIFENLTDIGDEVDFSRVTIEQLVKEFRRFKRDNELFRFEVRKIISDEIAKQVQPIQDKLDQITTKNPKIIYLKLRIPFFSSIVDFFKKTK